MVPFIFRYLFLVCSLEYTYQLAIDSTPVIIDTDAGADDAMGLLIALSDKNLIKVNAITCVSGNTGVENVTRNVLETLDVKRRLDIPVYRGAYQGLAFQAKSDNFFGTDGFGDFEYPNTPPSSFIKPEHAAEALVNSVQKAPGVITLIAVGPLTNVALAQHLDPNFLKNLKQFIVLGGSYQGAGNVRPGVEFNMYADPEAAAFVFSQSDSKHPIHLMPMETVLAASFKMEFRTDVLGKLGSPEMEFMNKAERKTLFKKNWTPFDQLAVSVVANPEIVISTRAVKMVVETQGSFSRGSTFVSPKSLTTNVILYTAVNKTMFKFQLLKDLA